MKKYILAIDQGTSSSRAILFDSLGQTIHLHQESITQIYPQPGWVEHDPLEILATELKSIKACLSIEEIFSIDSIGITNQRETTVVWDKNTGVPIYNAIVWQDKRTSERCSELIELGWASYISQNTGLVLDSYFSATKIEWILNYIPEAKNKAKNGDLLFGTIDTWLIWNLTGGRVHATDYSNASRTMLFNLHTLDWDEKLLMLFGIEKNMLPKILNSSDNYGETSLAPLPDGTPIRSAIGDQQAALFGHGCLREGSSKNTYGTGCFMLLNTGENKFFCNNGLLTTIAWGLNGNITYAMEGAVFHAGSAIQWLRDGIQIIKSSGDTEKEIEQIKDNGGVYFVPAFTGLGAPYWDMYARGSIFGITRGTTKSHIIRATLESLAYQTYDVLQAMQEESKLIIKELKVDGGASANNFLMQFQSDILQCIVNKSIQTETTSLGAAMLAGIFTKYYTIDNFQSHKSKGNKFLPQMSIDNRNQLIKKWHKAIEKSRDWLLEE